MVFADQLDHSPDNRTLYITIRSGSDFNNFTPWITAVRFPGAEQNKGQSDRTLLERYPKLQRSLRLLGIDSLDIDVPYHYTLRVRCLKSQSQTYREGAGLIDAERLQRESFLAAAG